MSIDFKKSAKNSMSISELHNGREKLETDDVKDTELTVDDFDIASMDDGVIFGVFTFTERPGFYYNGGLILTKMIKGWEEECGSIEAARESYAKLKPADKVKVKLSVGHPKNDKGKTLVSVEVL